MGNIKCLNCREEITTISGMECPHCKAQLTHVKIAFLSYLGPEDNAYAYKQSYTLVFLRCLFSTILENRSLSVRYITERFSAYYLARKEKGWPLDRNVDLRIYNIEHSTAQEVWQWIQMNPYATIAKKGFIRMKGDGIAGELVLCKDLLNLTTTEIANVLLLLDKKLHLYYRKIGSYAIDFEDSYLTNSGTDSAEPATSVESVDVLSASYADPTPLEKLSLSTRTYNALRRAQINTVGQLAEAYDSGKLAGVRHVGRTVLAEVESCLKSYTPASTLNESADVLEVTHDSYVLSDSIGESYKTLKIADVFHENAFVLFRQYCEQRQLETIGQLIGFNCGNLLHERGFGIVKVNRIVERWTTLENSAATVCADDNVQAGEDGEEMMLSESNATVGGAVCADNTEIIDNDDYLMVHESNDSLGISVLQLVGGSRKIPNALRAILNIRTLRDLENTSLTRLARTLNEDEMAELKRTAECFLHPYHDVVETLLDAVAEDDAYAMLLKRATGKTLQVIAEEHGITRERVRQICVKAERNITPLIKPLLAELMNQNSARYLREEQIREHIRNENHVSIVVYILHEGDEYTAIGSPAVFLETNAFPNAQKDLKELAADIVGDGMNIFENVERIESALDAAGYGFLTADDFLSVLIALEFAFYGDYVLQNKKSYGFLCACIVEDEYPDGISSSKEDLDRLRQLARNKYGDLNLPDNDRSLYSRLCDFLVLRGRSKYIAPSKIYIDQDILAEIKRYIDDSQQKSIYYMELFAEFEGLLTMMTNIDNPQFLHGVLRYYYPSDYSYGRDYLTKDTGESGQSLADRIASYITEKGGAVSKRDLLHQFPGVTEAVLFNVVNTRQGLLQWEFNYFNALSNFGLTDDDVVAIDHVLRMLIDENDGYCSEGMLYQKVQSELAHIIEKCSIKNPMNMFYIAQELLGDRYVFRNPHIARIGRFRNMVGVEIALELIGYKAQLSLREFTNMAKRLRWAEVSTNLIFSEIEKGYVRIATDTYIRKDVFNISNEDEDFVKEMLEDCAGDAWYLSLQVFAGSEEVLPSGRSVNEFLIGSLVKLNGFEWHLVEPQIKDRRFQRGILVRNGKNVFSYDQLVWEALKENGMISISEKDLLSFLIVHDLTLRYLPKELQTSSLFRYSEGIFTVVV